MTTHSKYIHNKNLCKSGIEPKPGKPRKKIITKPISLLTDILFCDSVLKQLIEESKRSDQWKQW